MGFAAKRGIPLLAITKDRRDNYRQYKPWTLLYFGGRNAFLSGVRY